MNNNYINWLYGDCGCGCQNNFKKIEDCDCEQILLDISNIHTDINVLQQEIDNIDINLEDYYTKDQIDALIPTNVSELVNDAGYITNAALVDYATKQWVESKGYLTEHTPLKTINGEVISGSGNIVIEASGGSVTVDDSLSLVSTNPVQNKVITEALNGKLDASAYTPTDLSNYYTKSEVNNTFQIKGDYVTSGNVETQITNHFWCGTQQEYDAIVNKENGVLYLIYE